MEKLLKHRRLYLILALVSLFLTVASVACMTIFGLNLSYAPLIISLVVAAYAFYSTPFYFCSYAKTKLYEKVIKALETGEDVSISLALKPEAVEKILKKCRAKKYIF